MDEQYTIFTVEDPSTGEKLYIPISNEDLLTKKREEIILIISTIIEKEFDEKFKSDISFNYTKINGIKSFYRQKINELVDEIIKLSDNIEAKYDTPEMEEWKAFKRFRNTLRDNFKK